MAAPVLKKLHFCYIAGQALSKAVGITIGDPAYEITVDPASHAYFWLEYDQSLDDHTAHPSRIETRSTSTTVLALIDITEVLAAGSAYANLSDYIASNDWQTQDGTYSVVGRVMVATDKLHWETGSTISPGDLVDSSLKWSCLGFQVPPGGLKDGHIYNLFRVPNQIDNKAGELEDIHSIRPGIMWETAAAAPPPPPPNLVRMYFFYSGGWSNSKTDLHFDDLDPAYDAPEDLSSAGTFVFEFDKPIDSGTAQKYSTSSGGMFATTPFVGVTDYTAINNGPGPIAYAGSNGGRWWEVHDQYNIEPFGKDITGVGVYPFNLSTIHSSLNAPAFHCLYFTAKVGALLADHEYRPYIIPSLLTDTSNVPLGSSTLPEFTFNGRVLKWKISDSIAPTIVSFTPANAATNVSVNASITVTFSEEVTLPVGQNVTYASVNAAGNWISQPAQVSYSSKTVTITPINPLPGTSIINVAVPTGVTDSAGNALPLQSWSFMTAAPPDTRVPIEAYAIGFTKDPDNFKSIPLTKSGTITQEFKIPAVDIDGPKIMYLRLRDQDGLISTNYRIALRVLDFELETFEVDTHGYCGGTTNQIDVLFDTDTDPTTMEYGYLIDDSGEPTVWNPVTPLSYDDVGKYKLNFNLDVSTISSGQHDLYVWLKTLEGEKKFCKTDFVSEPIPADPYGILTIKKSMIDGGKKKVWVEANVFDAGVGVSAISFVESTNPASFESINIIQNKRITKLFEYDASANTTNTFNLIIEDAVGRTSALITTSIDLSGVY